MNEFLICFFFPGLEIWNHKVKKAKNITPPHKLFFFYDYPLEKNVFAMRVC